MSFGGFGGFGQNNSSQQTSGSGFGGFGSSNNTTGTGFGTSNTNAGFGTSGTNTSGGGLFGTNSSGFGSGGGTFGGTGNTTSSFGSKPAFGGASTSTGGGLFGNTTSTAGASSTGFGGFGSTNTTTPASTGFGGGNTSSLFGNKTSTFGGANTGTSLFGGSGSGGFGSGNTTSAFGGANSTALNQNPGQNNGTGSVPFTAHKEQEGTTSTTNHFQTITFISPYQGFSLEELRLADYNQGRRFGNASGQAGAFGTNSFGTTSGGATGFGANTTSTNLFGGSATNTSTGFGGNASGFGGTSTNTGGGLFGAASKPTSLFGSTATASPKPSGGLFGGASGGSGFGGTNNASTGFGGTGNSLFGGSGTNNNSTSTGSGFTFGGAGTTTGGFGQNNATGFGSGNTSSGTGLFGSTATSAPFGGQTTQATTGSNLFGGFGGQQTQQPSQPGQTSSLFGGGFGNNQQSKPGGLFGGSTNTATTGGSLFGNNNQQPNQQSSGGLFGSNNQNQSSGGLFGAKPATGTSTGTGLFGNTTQNNTAAGGGLFGGGNQAQQPAGGSLFGGGAAQSKPGGLFGGLGTSTSNAGSSLFGSNNNNNNQQQQGSSLFPSMSTNQGQPSQPGSSLFGSTLNGSQQSNPQALHQQGLQASLVDINSFGDSQGFFSGVSNLPDVGPLATPLSSSQKQRKSTLLPAYRTNPASASKLFTPVRQGYGLQYSRYGTPGSAFSSAASTPAGLSSSLLRNSFSKNLGKSLSTSNLRHTYEADESILAPGAFTPTGRRMNSGIKTLHINRGLRGDLFGTPTPAEQPKALTGSERNESAPLGRSVRKRVSFDADVSGGLPEGASNGSTPSAQEQGFLRSSKNINGSNGAAKSGPSQPEMEQVRGNELAVVHEDDSNPTNLLSHPAGPANSQDDLQIGDYWMRPSKEELSKLSPDKLKKVENFIVGRHGCGYVKFDRPVDLSTFKLDRIPEDTVHITTRAITVYPVASQKPPQGKGLNVPSTIALQNSWPRAKGGKDKVFERNGPKFNKHVERLKRVTDTEFISYDRDTGVWTFTVQHFTTYGLEYDDETDGDDLNQSTLSLPPDSPSPAPRKLNGNHMPRSYAPPSTGQRSAFQSDVPSEADSPQMDDTFRFKAYKPQSTRAVPGAFDDDVMAVEAAYESDDQSFLDDRSVGSSRQDGDDESSQVDDVTNGEFDESVMDEEEDPASLYPQLGHTTEPVNYQNSLMLSTRTDPFVAPTPKSILKSRRRMSFGTPTKVNLDLDADWTEQLQRTISPKKQDRVVLRQNQEVLLQADDAGATPKADRNTMAHANEFRNSMDLMNSLWGTESGRKVGKGKRGLEIDQGIQWPYAKKPKTFDLDVSSMDQNDRGFYESFKPSWSQSGMLVCVAPMEKNYNDQTQAFRASGVLGNNRITLASEGRNVELIPFDLPSNPSPKLLAKQRQNTKITAQNGVPYAKTTTAFNFKDLADTIDGQDAQAVHERSAWELVGILFDNVEHNIPKGVGAEEQTYLESRLRKDNLSDFWVQLVQGAATQQVQLAKSAEEKVIAHLSAHDIEGACSGLIDGRNFRLATLVALIGGDERMRDDMKAQIQTWRDAKSLSEFEEPIRALYELLTGNVCGVYGIKGPAEDRATSLLFSERFGFNWRQCFGMRLWYAIFEEDPLELAVQKFSEELEAPQNHNGDELQESSRPVPWFVEQKISKLWQDPNIAQRHDLLWSLLRLYADDSEKSNEILDDVLLPHNHQLSPLDYRLSWLLYQNLSAKDIAQFPSGKEKGRIVYDERVDRLTLDYAWQLERSGDWSWATFVLLHVHDHNNRQTALQSIIARHAGEIGGRQSLHFVDLVTNFRIPESWVWEAKALYAREVERDFTAEVDYLLKAQNWEEAHKTLCSIVAPHSIIESSYSALERILSGFENVDLVRDWSLGGQVYLDFIHMRHLTEGTSNSHVVHSKQKGLPKENDIDDVLKRLVSTLPAMATKDRNVEFLQQVSVQEMSGIVGKALMARREANHSTDLSRVLQLPLTEDMYLKHSVNLSFDYYRTLMAGGK